MPAQPALSFSRRRWHRSARPAGLILGLALRSGGFFPASTGIAAVAVLVILVVRATSAGTPFAGVGTGLAVAAIALIAFATWTLLSSSWSGSAARASLESIAGCCTRPCSC